MLPAPSPCGNAASSRQVHRFACLRSLCVIASCSPHDEWRSHFRARLGALFQQDIELRRGKLLSWGFEDKQWFHSRRARKNMHWKSVQENCSLLLFLNLLRLLNAMSCNLLFIATSHGNVKDIVTLGNLSFQFALIWQIFLSFNLVFLSLSVMQLCFTKKKKFKG